MSDTQRARALEHTQAELRALLTEARAYIESIALLSRHPTTSSAAMNLYERIGKALSQSPEP
jgi:hypothetical protein